MASDSSEVDSDVTISDTSSSDVPVDEIPPPVIDVEEEVDEIPPPVVDVEKEVATEQRTKEVEVPDRLNDLPGNEPQDWRVFARKRKNGHIDKTYIHKKYRHQFRSRREVELFVKMNGITTGIFKGKKLQKKKIPGMDAQDAGTSKSAGRSASDNLARSKRSIDQSGSMDDEDIPPPGFL